LRFLPQSALHTQDDFQTVSRDFSFHKDVTAIPALAAHNGGEPHNAAIPSASFVTIIANTHGM